LLQELGFVDIRQHHYAAPISTWPLDKKYKLRGEVYERRFDSALQRATKLLQASGLSKKEVTELAEGWENDITSHRIHGSMCISVIYARKSTS
jgi:hypothetical protein